MKRKTSHISFSRKILQAIMLVILIIIVFALYSTSERRIDSANKRKQDSWVLADELHHTIDDTTHMARAYIDTDNPIFKKYHQSILNIMNGTQPRPERYSGIYWDLFVSQTVSPRPITLQVIPLITLMQQAGLTTAEFNKITAALSKYKELIKIEHKAFSLMDTTTSHMEINQKKARSLLFDREYFFLRSEVMRSIDDLLQMVSERTNQEVTSLVAQTLLFRNAFIFLCIILFFIIYQIRKNLYETMGASVNLIYGQIQKLGRGDFTYVIPREKVIPNSVLDWIIESQEKLRELESKLEYREAILRELVENMKSAVVIYKAIDNGEDFEFVNLNCAGEQIEKVKRENIIGKSVREIFPGMSPDILIAFQRVYKTGVPLIVPATFYQDDRISGWRENYIYRLPTGEIVSVYDDVTKNIQAAELLRQAKENADNANLAKSKFLAIMKQAKENADNANNAKSKFLAIMSHEMRTPLHSIIGITEILMSSPLNKEQNDLLKIAHNSGENLLCIINDTLDFSRIESELLSIENIPFLLTEQIQSSIAIVSIRAKQKNINLSWQIEEGISDSRRGDPARLRQILINLLNNAIKFSDKGIVSLKVEKAINEEKQSKLFFSVTDQGIGIPKDKQSLIFESFKQVDESVTRNFGGSGLGLAISKKLVELMNGKIGVKSSPGKGSTFFFSIVLPETVTGQNFPTWHLTKKEEKETATPSFLKILIADDHEENLLIFELFLQKKHRQIYTVKNGQEAFDMIKKEKFDIVFMDVGMATMDGYTATKKIRRWEEEYKKERTIIIACTANAFENDIKESQEAGCDDHLAKPFPREKLLEMLAKYSP